MPTHHPSGQASPEYVAILLFIGALFASAGALAVAVPPVGERVAKTIRTGLCIVGGDVCRTADARSAGLNPCVTRARSKRQDTTLDIAVVRLGGRGEWQLAVQSDGGAVVTRLDESELGGTVGVGVTLGSVVDVGASAAVLAGYRGARAWRFADAAAAGAFLDAAMHDAERGRAPDVRWHALRSGAAADAGVTIAYLVSAGLTTSAETAIGLRTEGAKRTVTYDIGLKDLDVVGQIPGFPSRSGTRNVVADVTWEAGEPRELAVRTAVATPERVEETTARVDLREPEGRALAERLLRPGAIPADPLRAVARHAAQYGIVERTAYAVSERARGLTIAGRLGISLGISHNRITAERRLVDAVAWVRGGPPQRRLDCLGV